MEDRLLHTMALGLTPQIGPITAKALVEHFGHASAVYRFLESGFTKLEGFGAKLMSALSQGRSLALRRARKELEMAKAKGISIIGYWQEDFPWRLWACPDSPLFVYGLGKPSYNQARSVCILGNNIKDAYNNRLVNYLLKGLRAYGVHVICGNDSVWERSLQSTCTALEVPSTVVLSESIYTDLKQTSEKTKTCYLSAHSHSTKPVAHQSRIKSKIMAGLSDLCIVLEAGKFDPVMEVAEMANDYHRDVAAFPGSIWRKQSYGTHFLIKTHQATLMSRVEDLGYIMGWSPL